MKTCLRLWSYLARIFLERETFQTKFAEKIKTHLIFFVQWTNKCTINWQCLILLDLELKKKLVKCYIWSIALYGAENWTLRAVNQKHLESFEMWCWGRMEKIRWTDIMKNEDAVLRVKEQRNILHETRKRKANWIGHILRRNCLLQRVIEGKIKGGKEVTGRQGRRRRKLLDDLKERRGYSHL